ncbi:MAG: DinB family protein [Acidobacteriota bacterium]
MTINDGLLSEFDEEVARTRKTLERVPADKGEYVPHPKSMPMGKLAAHVAQLTEFGHVVLATPELNFSSSSYKPLPFESAEQLVKVLDEGAAKVRSALAGVADEAWKENWKLVYDGRVIFDTTRFLAYRELFLNHVIHHRAQLGVYLRLNGVPVPATYGPSADEPFTP